MHKARGMDFQEVMNYFLNYGYVFSTPKYLVLGEEALYKDLGPVWLVWYASVREGNPLSLFFSLMPYYLPYIAFSRAHSADPFAVHVYQTDKLRKKLNKC